MLVRGRVGEDRGLLQETIGCTAGDNDAAEPHVNWRHFCGLLSLFIDAVVHYAEGELDEHCKYDDNAEDLMARVEFLALGRASAQPARIMVCN
jgi:hypothetical protein